MPERLTEHEIEVIVKSWEDMHKAAIEKGQINPEVTEILPFPPTLGPHCPDCHDLRVVFTRDHRGKIASGVPCHCAEAAASYLRIVASGLQDKIEDLTFGTYMVIEPWQEKIVNDALRYTEHVKQGGHEWFVMLGQTGFGKTHICTAVSGVLLKSGTALQWETWNALKNIAKRRFGDFGRGEENNLEFERLKRVPVLYIDDLFAKKQTEADIEAAFDLLDFRYSARMPTIISSEYSPRDLAKIDEATASRIVERSMNSGFLIYEPLNSDRNWRMKAKRNMFEEAEKRGLRT